MATIALPAIVSLIVVGLSGPGAAWRQRDRLRTELELEFATETAIRALLSDNRFAERKRSFTAIKRRLPGFEDDELRRHLIRAGAIAFRKKDTPGDEGEVVSRLVM